MDADGGRAYVSLGAGNAHIAVLDITAVQPRFIADVPTVSSAMVLGDTKLGIATHPTDPILYSLASGGDRLSYFNLNASAPVAGPVVRTYASAYPVGVSVDGTGNRVLVQAEGTPAGDPNNARLYAYEARTGEAQWTLRLGPGRALVGPAVLEDDGVFRAGFEP